MNGFSTSFLMRVASVLLLALVTANCSGSGIAKTSGNEVPRSRSAADGRADYDPQRDGLRVGSLFGSRAAPSGLPVNALLWRASLDTLSVIPLVSVDTFGGSIISDWHTNPDDPSRRIKVSVFVLDQELRSDGIRAEVHVQQRAGGSSEWTDAGRDKDLAVKLEELILTRAREIRSSSISETN